MTWDDVKTDYVSSMLASEYNDLVAAVKHTSAQAAKWATFDSDATYNFRIAATERLRISYSSPATTIQGGLTTGDALTLKANNADAYPKIKLTGALTIDLYGQTGINLYSSATNFGQLTLSGSDMQIKSMGTNYNIALVPNGSGLVKFGTWTSHPDIACNGYITILDSSGNTRHIMTCG